jgi:hypothetical protein
MIARNAHFPLCGLAPAFAAAAQSQTELAIGIAPVVPDASTFLAIDLGYLKGELI